MGAINTDIPVTGICLFSVCQREKAIRLTVSGRKVGRGNGNEGRGQHAYGANV